jgi:uncharacterized membrane protein YjjP (DUF1212 family)
MKISGQDKLLLFEMEFLALALIIILGFAFYWLRQKPFFYLTTLLIGFAFYFWMLLEENVHKTLKKHAYFEHTSSYIIIGQASLVLGLLFQNLSIDFLIIMFLIISVIMYSVSLSRVILYKVVFKK